MPRYCPCPVCRAKLRPEQRRHMFMVLGAIAVLAIAWASYCAGYNSMMHDLLNHQ